MSRPQQKITKLMQYGIDSGVAAILAIHGFGVSKLKTATISELTGFLGEEQAKAAKSAVTRSPIAIEVINRLIGECRWSCCLCWNTAKSQPVIVHHIEAYENSQDNGYDNLVVLCPNHHAEAHSKSSLTGDLIPKERLRQSKQEFIEAIGAAKAGKRSFPGNEPHPAYGWDEIKLNCQRQVEATLTSLSSTYDRRLYVNRGIEADFERFSRSAEIGFLIIDKSGYGKTNLLCYLSSELTDHGKAVVFLRGDDTLTDEYSLERLLSTALGYESGNFQFHLQSIAQTLVANNQLCIVFLDGISGNQNSRVANQAISNLLVRLSQLSSFKLCITCRDTDWYKIGFDLPLHLFFRPKTAPPEVSPRFVMRELTEQELIGCLPHYKMAYQLEFSLSGSARNILRNPLLLRLFCEAHQGQNLGHVSEMPYATIYDRYLLRKTEAAARRTNNKYRASLLQKCLRSLALEMWKVDNAKLLNEAQWQHCLSTLAGIDWSQAIEELESEGVIELQEDNLTLNQTLKIVFDKLQEYLVLSQLLALLPAETQSALNNGKNYEALVAFAASHPENTDDLRMLSLVGMLTSDVVERKKFLNALLQFDFHTFCTCLSYIPPVGSLSQCTYHSKSVMAEELRHWYEYIAQGAFPTVFEDFDPWAYQEQVESIAIKITVSRECKELSYYYKSLESKNGVAVPVDLKMGARYPTWTLSFGNGKDQVPLHDPEKGMVIQEFRDGPYGEVTRTINENVYPRFPGDSYNVPERMALWDIWSEVKHLISNNALPIQPRELAAEDAWSIALRVPELTAEGLTLATYEHQLDKLMIKYSDEWQDHSSVGHSALRRLYNSLKILSVPLRSEMYPLAQYRTGSGSAPQSLQEIPDEQLKDYLFRTIGGAIRSYNLIVEHNFPNLKSVLNTYVNSPCTIGLVSDRQHVRFSQLPVPTSEEALLQGIVIPHNDVPLADPTVRFQLKDENGNEVSFDYGVNDQLRQLSKLRPPIHPIDRIILIEEFFIETPMNALVQQWLMQDLKSVFNF